MFASNQCVIRNITNFYLLEWKIVYKWFRKRELDVIAYTAGMGKIKLEVRLLCQRIKNQGES